MIYDAKIFGADPQEFSKVLYCMEGFPASGIPVKYEIAGGSERIPPGSSSCVGERYSSMPNFSGRKVPSLRRKSWACRMTAQVLPPVTTIMVTGVCGLKCPFCFGPVPSTPTLDISDWRNILKFLRIHSVAVLLIGGGEPTAYPQIHEFLESARAFGFRSSLATSCHWPSRAESLLDYLDWIEISLHGSTAVLHAQSGLSPRSFDGVFEVLEILSRREDPKVKINTVVSQINWSNLEAIAQRLAGYRVRTLKWLEVRPRGQALLNIQWLPWSFAENKDYLNEARMKCSDILRGTDIVVSPADRGDNAYLIVDPDGRVFVPKGSEEVSLGNIRQVLAGSELEKAAFVETVGKHVSTDKLVGVFEESFSRKT